MNRSSLVAFLACSLTASSFATIDISEPFAGANGFSLVVGGDLDMDGGHIHGAALVGQDLLSTGNDVPQFGSDAKYNDSLSLYVERDIKTETANTSTIGLSSGDVFYNGSSNATFQNLGTDLGSNPFGSTTAKDLFGNFEDKADYLSNLSDSDGTALSFTGDSTNPNINFEIKKGVTNLININGSDVAVGSRSFDSVMAGNSSNISFVELEAGALSDPNTKLIINYTFEGDLNLAVKNQQWDPSKVLWNFIGSGDIVRQQDLFYGSILAVDSHFSRIGGSDLDGQIVAQSVDWNDSRQIHYEPFWTTSTPVPEVPTVFISLLASVVFVGKRLRSSKKKRQ